MCCIAEASVQYQRKNLKWNGWGWQDKTFDFEGREDSFWSYVSDRLGVTELRDTPSLDLDEVPLPASRLSDEQQQELRRILDPERVHFGRFERIFHAVGRSYHDLIRLRSGTLRGVPDAIVYPQTEIELQHLIGLAERWSCALIPFGGGSSVVGGVEGDSPAGFAAVITVDMTHMNRVLSIDEESLMARVESGIYGPELEAQLQQRGYTLGHYPQSFEFSTLGGWVAARGSGQQSNRYGSAATFLVGAKVVTPAGIFETQPLPNASSGPDLKHLIAGSEGIFGFITEVTVAIQPVPSHRDYQSYLLPSFAAGVKAIKEMVQSKLEVAMLRLSDEDETEFYSTISSMAKEKTWIDNVTKRAVGAIFPKQPCVLMIGLEGPRKSVLQTSLQVGKICLQNKGVPLGGSIGNSWFETRFETPYLRDRVLDRGIAIDTLETATSWSNIPRLYAAVRTAIREGIQQSSPTGKSIVLAHISHSYNTGASLYFSFLFEMSEDNKQEQWRVIKGKASDAIRDNGGTISHHHGVGVDHVDWITAEKGALGMNVIAATKSSLDPSGLMNPGKILPHPQAALCVVGCVRWPAIPVSIKYNG